MYPLANRSGFKLYDMCYNYRREHRLSQKRAKPVDFEEEIMEDNKINDQMLDDYESELRRMNPRSHDAIIKCKELMEKTRFRRRKLISSEQKSFGTTTEILDRWPAFRALPFTLVIG